MPPRINIHKRIEEANKEANKYLKEELDGIPIKETPETFEEFDKVYIKSLQWYASKGWGDYHNQEKFWGIQIDEHQIQDKQFVFIAYLQPHEQISRNPSGQTYDEYVTDFFLLDKDPNDLMSKETFEEKYPKPDVVIYQNLNDKKKVPEIGEFIYTTSSNITKHKKVIEIIQKQKEKEIKETLKGDKMFNTHF